MLKIGAVLFAIGVFFLLPFDEVLILLPLIAIYGLAVVPVYYTISIICLVVGAALIGKHLMPWLVSNPIGIVMLLLALGIAVYLWVPL